MITLSTALKAKKNAQAGGEWIWLVEIERDDSNVVRYTNSQADVTFMSYTWTHKPLRIARPEQDQAGSVFEFTVEVGNADKVMSGYTRAGEIIDKCVTIYHVNRSTLSTPTDFLTWRGVCNSITLSKGYASLVCGPPNLRDFTLPRRRYIRSRCQHVFKGPECGYSGGETSCDKTPDTCSNTMDNYDSFGAFPGMLEGNE